MLLKFSWALDLVVDLVSLSAKKSRFNTAEAMAYRASCARRATYRRPQKYMFKRRVGQSLE